MTVARTTAAALRDRLLDGGEIAVLDAREQGMFSAEHLFWGSCVPLSHLELLVADLVPRRSCPVVFVDAEGADGGVAERAAVRLADLGWTDVSVLAGGVAAWPGELELGAVELQKTKATLEPRLDAVPTWEELRDRLDDPELTILDVRSDDEYCGRGGYPCDPRQGHIPGARHLEVERLFAAPGQPQEPSGIRELAGLPEGASIVAYCHSGSRSALAALALRAGGYEARNYPGSWHEWSRHEDLPAER